MMNKNKWTNIGYRCGQLFACTCLMCLLVMAVAITIKFLQWLF